MLGPRPRPLEIAGTFFFLFNFYKNSFQAPYFNHILFPPLIPNSSQIPTCPTHVLSSHLPQSRSEIQLKIKTGKQLLKKTDKTKPHWKPWSPFGVGQPLLALGPSCHPGHSWPQNIMYRLWGGRPNLFFGHACWLMSGYINSAFWFQNLLKKRDGILNLGWHYIQRGRSRKLRRMWHPGTQEGKDQDVRVLFCLGEESMEAPWRYGDHHLWWNESMENSI